MKEIWKLFRDGWYEVSNYGRVRRSKSGKATTIGRLTTPIYMDGYEYVALSCGSAKSVRRFGIHQLVAEVFLGHCPNGKEVNHKDGVPSNNLPMNLEYVTRSENILHAVKIGLKPPLLGERNGKSTLTRRDVYAIRALAKLGISVSKIVEKLSLPSTGGAYSVLSGRTWRHLK